MSSLRWAAFELCAEDEADIAALTAGERTIGHAGARQLRRLCRVVRPRTILEVGTREGMSTRALDAEHAIYTCDHGPERTAFDHERIYTFWNTESKDLLRDLIEAGVPAFDLIFYDASLRDEDPELLRKLMHFETVFAFHDYLGNQKGVRGVRAVLPLVPHHVLVKPRIEDQSGSVAVLAPAHIAKELAAR